MRGRERRGGGVLEQREREKNVSLLEDRSDNDKEEKVSREVI